MRINQITASLIFAVSVVASAGPINNPIATSSYALINQIISEASRFSSEALTFQAKEQELNNENHTEILVSRKGDQTVITLAYDSVAAKTPVLLLPDLVLLSAITNSNGGKSIFSFDPHMLTEFGELSGVVFPKTNRKLYAGWVEIFKNAEMGSLSAKAAKQNITLRALKSLTITEELQKILTSLDISSENLIELTNKSEKQVATLNNQATESQSQQLAAYNEGLIKARVSSEVLSNLILNNDRKGVAELFRTHLPWSLMEPIEKEMWTRWVASIEQPDLSNSELLFRGIGFANRVLRRQLEQETISAFTSSSLEGNGNLEKVFLESRLLNGNIFTSSKSVPASMTISFQMLMHSFRTTKSSFMSFSSDYSVAMSFVGAEEARLKENAYQGLLAVRVDKRRIMPNFTSGVSEREYLVPLIIFPDELVFFKEINSQEDRAALKSEAQLEKMANEIKKKSGISINLNRDLNSSDLDGKFEKDSVAGMYELLGRSPEPKPRAQCKKLF